MSIEKTVTNLTTLKINYLTDEMYEDALENNQINENELYMTPSSGGTSVPTADTLAEFDNDAHMNSEDMSAQDVSDFIDGLNISAPSALIDFFYPVGSYYETSNTSFNPNIAWSGTWVLEIEGQVHVSGSANGTYVITKADNNNGVGESDGGSPYIQAHTHGFTQPKIPNHQHSMNNLWSDGSGSSSAYTMSSSRKLTTRKTANDGGGGACTGGAVGAVSGLPSGQTTGSAGNMPPYIIVNRWHRVA